MGGLRGRAELVSRGSLSLRCKLVAILKGHMELERGHGTLPAKGHDARD